jgi:hypothetical protein
MSHYRIATNGLLDEYIHEETLVESQCARHISVFRARCPFRRYRPSARGGRTAGRHTAGRPADPNGARLRRRRNVESERRAVGAIRAGGMRGRDAGPPSQRLSGFEAHRFKRRRRNSTRLTELLDQRLRVLADRDDKARLSQYFRRNQVGPSGDVQNTLPVPER